MFPNGSFWKRDMTTRLFRTSWIIWTACKSCRKRSGSTSFWLLPSVFPADKEGMERKCRFLGEMLEKMGVPLMDDSIYALVEEFFEKMPEGK